MKKTHYAKAIFFIFPFLIPVWGQSHFSIIDQQALEAFANFEVENDKSELNSKTFANDSLNLDLTDDNPVYLEIINYFSRYSREITQQIINESLGSGGLQASGGLNHVGLNYSKGFANFSIELRRDIAPDLFSDDQWIVTDRFNLNISASQLLGNLRDNKIIDITDAQMGLFAGISFKRSYTYIHYEESYENALLYNLDKLFFSFLNFKSNNFLEIEEGELLKKEDSISYAVGAAGNSVLVSGVGVHLAALVEYTSLANITLQAVSENDKLYDGEWLRVSTEKSSEISTQVNIGVVADFINILQMSLLKYEFTYSFKESSGHKLSFHEDDKDSFDTDSDLGNTMTSLLRYDDIDEDVISDYVISSQESEQLAIDSRYESLIFGTSKETDTTHYKITTDESIHSFFSHNFSTEIFRQNIFSEIFGMFLKSFFSVGNIVNNSKEESRNVNIQYKDVRNLMLTQEDLVLDSQSEEEKLSMNFMRKYYAYSATDNNLNELVDYLEQFSGVDPLIIAKVNNGFLTESLNFYSMYTMTEDAIDYFNDLDTSEVYEVFDDICQAKRSESIWGWFYSLFSRCESTLKSEYDLYQIEWNSSDLSSEIYENCEQSLEKYLKKRVFASSRKKRQFLSSCTQKLARKTEEEMSRELPIWRLSKLMDTFLSKAESKVYYFRLFGLSNVHVLGKVSGSTSEDNSFIHYFSEGNFKGIDLISTFEKDNGLKSSLEVN